MYHLLIYTIFSIYATQILKLEAGQLMFHEVPEIIHSFISSLVLSHLKSTLKNEDSVLQSHGELVINLQICNKIRRSFLE